MKKTKTINLASKLVKEIALLEIKNKDLIHYVMLLDLKFEDMDRGDITPVKIEMSLDLVAMIRDRLNIAGINNGGFNKELDIITQYLVEKRNWFIEQEKKKSSIALRKLLNAKDCEKSSAQIISKR